MIITCDLNQPASNMDGIPFKQDWAPKSEWITKGELQEPPAAMWGDLLRMFVLRKITDGSVDELMDYMDWCGCIAEKQPLQLTASQHTLLISQIQKSPICTLELKGPLLRKLKDALAEAERKRDAKVDDGQQGSPV